MNRKLIIPALALLLALLGCSIPINFTGNPPVIPTGTPIPPATNTETSIPTSQRHGCPKFYLPQPSRPIPTHLIPPPTATETPALNPSPSPVPSSVPELSVDNPAQCHIYNPVLSEDC